MSNPNPRPLADPEPVPDNVLEGRDGWLFLGEGTNFSISQMTGQVAIDPRELTRWVRVLQLRAQYFGERYRTLVCPEKAAVLDEFLPDGYAITPDRAATKLHRMIPDFGYPLEAMKASVHHPMSYPVNDTHLSDPMTASLAAGVIESFGMTPGAIFDSLEYEEREIMGDLGGKYSVPRRANKAFATNLPPLDVLDSELRNRGRIMRYTNAAIDGPSLLIFGDSFSAISMARFLCLHFRTVHFVHSTAIDYALCERLEPDFVLGQYAERFLLTSPIESLSVSSLIFEKLYLKAYTDEMVAGFLDNLEAFSDYIPATERAVLRRACRMGRG